MSCLVQLCRSVFRSGWPSLKSELLWEALICSLSHTLIRKPSQRGDNTLLWVLVLFELTFCWEQTTLKRLSVTYSRGCEPLMHMYNSNKTLWLHFIAHISITIARGSREAWCQAFIFNQITLVTQHARLQWGFSFISFRGTLWRSYCFMTGGWSVLQLSQATQSHCGVSLLRPQQLHGQTFSRDQPGLDLQLCNKMQTEGLRQMCMTVVQRVQCVWMCDGLHHSHTTLEVDVG